ncbi:hypothetical protein JCM10213v2_005561 [Rhodosporidiobolus nylandii]
MLEAQQGGVVGGKQKKPSAFHRLLARLNGRVSPPRSSVPPETLRPRTTPSTLPGQLLLKCPAEDRRVWLLQWEGVDMIVKEGKDVDAGEAQMTEFARTATGLPIPRVYASLQDGDCTSIFLEKLPGTILHDRCCWLEKNEREAVLEDIKDAFHRLHGLPAPPGTRVGGLGRKNLAALLNATEVSPSLSSTAELHAWLKRRHHATLPSRSVNYEQAVVPHLDDSAPLVLVHGDLHGGNVLVHEGRLSGLIDFGRAGWYPEWVERWGLLTQLRYERTLAEVLMARKLVGREAVDREEHRWMWLAWDGWAPSE